MALSDCRVAKYCEQPFFKYYTVERTTLKQYLHAELCVLFQLPGHDTWSTHIYTCPLQLAEGSVSYLNMCTCTDSVAEKHYKNLTLTKFGLEFYKMYTGYRPNTTVPVFFRCLGVIIRQPRTHALVSLSTPTWLVSALLYCVHYEHNTYCLHNIIKLLLRGKFQAKHNPQSLILHSRINVCIIPVPVVVQVIEYISRDTITSTIHAWLLHCNCELQQANS